MSHTIWDVDIQKMFLLKRVIYYFLRMIHLVFEGFVKNKCAVWTTNLAYKTLLSIIPFLAVVFYFVDTKALTGTQTFQKYVLDNLAIGAGEQVKEYLLNLSSQVNMSALGVVGVVFLILTVLTLLSTIEGAFNNIWGVQKTRPFFIQITTYWSVVTIGPLLVLLSISLSAALLNQSLVQKITHIEWLSRGFVFVLPFILSSIALAILYVFMPNAKVKAKSALIGGLIAGCLWEFSKIGFGYTAQNFFSYDKLYGSFAAFPVFLIWLYISWLIVMLGAEIVFADQHMKSYGKEKKVEGVHFAFKEYLALHVMRYLALRFHSGKPEVSVEEMASDMGMPVRLINEVAYYLLEAGLVVEVSEEFEIYQIAKPLEKITLQDVLDAIRKRGIALKMEVSQESKYLKDFMARVEEHTRAITTGTSYFDIVKMTAAK
ncbi:MAG: YihY family inner membrane protein [Deltaproteobacteria bacterium]|nr:YihY family inner membrane protein [Deltaproteobacteria bacterium]